jgi:hypothetical protein
LQASAPTTTSIAINHGVRHDAAIMSVAEIKTAGAMLGVFIYFPTESTNFLRVSYGILRIFYRFFTSSFLSRH